MKRKNRVKHGVLCLPKPNEGISLEQMDEILRKEYGCRNPERNDNSKQNINCNIQFTIRLLTCEPA